MGAGASARAELQRATEEELRTAYAVLPEEERAALLAMLSPTGDSPGVRVPDGASQQEREESWDVGDADECLLEEVDLSTDEYQERGGQERDEGFRGFRWAM